jgi:hypothetical protein
VRESDGGFDGLNQIDHICINAIFGAQNFRHPSLTKLKHHAIAMIKTLAILIIKIVFFESPPTMGFQKNNFGVSSSFGAGNTKIVFITI